MKSLITTLLSCLVIGISTGCTPESPQTPSEPAITNEVLEEWGYSLLSNEPLVQKEWQIEQFGKATGNCFKIKATSQVPDWPAAYYRFTITEEVYPSAKRALARLKKLHEIPSKFDTKQNPNLLLNKGFVMDNRVIVVSTDVLTFEQEELPRVYSLLKTHLEKRTQ